MDQGQSISQKTNQELQPQSSSRLPLILIGFVLILAAGAGGVYLGKYLYGPKAPQISTSVTPTPRADAPTATPTQDATADWKTYTNEFLKFSFEYPSQWSPQVSERKEKQMVLRLDFPHQLVVEAYKDSLIYGKTAESYLSYLKKLSEDPDLPALTVSSTHKRIGNNIDGFQIEVGGIDVSKTVAFDNKRHLYLFTLPLTSMSPTEQIENEKFFDHILSTFKFLDASFPATIVPTTTTQTDGADLKDIKYSLPKEWEAKLDEKSLFISPINGGGFLSIMVYNDQENIGRREYYCQVSKVCMEGITYFTDMSIGNISGYIANSLDNSGGGPEYFGTKGNKFYIIRSYGPPPPNEFEKNYRNVLDSLRF